MGDRHPGHTTAERLRLAIARNTRGLTALQNGQLSAASGLFESAAATFAELGLGQETSTARHNMALTQMRLGQLSRAQELLDTAFELAPDDRSDGPVRHEAAMRMTAGSLARRQGRIQVAFDHYARARELYERLGDADDVLDVRLNVAVLHERTGALDLAWQELSEVRSLVVTAVGRPEGEMADDELERLARADTTLSAVAGRQGRYAVALTLLAEAEAIYRDLKQPRALADVLTNQGYAHQRLGDFTTARHLLRQAYELFDAMKMELDAARLLGGLASLERRLGNHAGAAAAYEDVLVTYRGAGLKREITDTVISLSAVRVSQERWSEAVDLLRSLGDPDDAATRAAIDVNLGIALAGLEDWDGADTRYHAALAYYERAGHLQDAADVNSNLGIVATARGDLAGARWFYARANYGYRKLGLVINVARCLHNDGLTWPADSRDRLERVVPAWLVLEATRFVLRVPSDRMLWREEIGKHAAAAFNAALLAGSPLLLAEIIERARSFGNLDLSRPGPLAATEVNVDDDDLLGRSLLGQAEEDALVSLPVTSAAAVGCGPTSELAPFVTAAQAIIDLRAEAGVSLAADTVTVSAVLVE